MDLYTHLLFKEEPIKVTNMLNEGSLHFTELNKNALITLVRYTPPTKEALQLFEMLLNNGFDINYIPKNVSDPEDVMFRPFSAIGVSASKNRDGYTHDAWLPFLLEAGAKTDVVSKEKLTAVDVALKLFTFRENYPHNAVLLLEHGCEIGSETGEILAYYEETSEWLAQPGVLHYGSNSHESFKTNLAMAVDEKIDFWRAMSNAIDRIAERNGWEGEWIREIMEYVVALDHMEEFSSAIWEY